MTIVNLKELYSNYYIRQWKKQGLPLITERPPTTTQTLLDNFFAERYGDNWRGRSKQKQVVQIERRKAVKSLNWRDYLKEEYK